MSVPVRAIPTRSSATASSMRCLPTAESGRPAATMAATRWAAAAFRQARDQRGQRYHRALRGLSARWMRVLWRCWTNHVSYHPDKHTSAAELASTADQPIRTSRRPPAARLAAMPAKPRR